MMIPSRTNSPPEDQEVSANCIYTEPDLKRHVSWSLCVQWVIVRGSSPFCWYWCNCWPTIFFNFLIDKKCTYLCSYLKQNKQLYYKVYCNNFNKLLTILFALQTSYLFVILPMNAVFATCLALCYWSCQVNV
jgi:hypothetical protein